MNERHEDADGVPVAPAASAQALVAQALTRAAARQVKLEEALQRIADMDPNEQRADDLGRAAGIARIALGNAGVQEAGRD